MPAGRPSEYTPERAAIICERLAEGDSLRAICLERDMADKSTVFRWLDQHPEFREQYDRARERQADTYADQIIDIADTEEDPQKARVRIDARKWVSSKLLPKKYGDKAELNATVRYALSQEQRDAIARAEDLIDK